MQTLESPSDRCHRESRSGTSRETSLTSSVEARSFVASDKLTISGSLETQDEKLG